MSESQSSIDPRIERNRRAYDACVRRYERRHGELFNPIEQARLRESLERATGDLAGEEAVRALDFGAGTGNVTAHLVDLGCRVTAADVSDGCLDRIEQRFGDRVERFRLNGRDLREFEDGAFDLAVAFSVLHHIPDYLLAVSDLARVVRPGGVVVIDHEATDTVYENPPAYRQWRRKARPWWEYVLKYVKPSNYLWGLRLLMNPRYQPEGDIHVYPDDRIEWGRVREALREAGCEILRFEKYLVYRRRYDREMYERLRGRIDDMGCLHARKTAEP